MNIQVLEMPRDRSGGYKVDVSRGERIGRVSSEWFSRPADERFLSLGALREAVGEFRRCRTASLVERLERAVAEGELPPDTDTQALGDYFATVLHGLSVQARDGVSKARLMAMIPAGMGVLAPTDQPDGC